MRVEFFMATGTNMVFVDVGDKVDDVINMAEMHQAIKKDDKGGFVGYVVYFPDGKWGIVSIPELKVRIKPFAWLQ